ncbi:ferredoxin [Streptomyces sp. TE5632]
MKRITVDTSKCSGHGRCYTLASAFFDYDDEGFPVILEERVPDDREGIADLLSAVDNCPERAISVSDEA